MTAKTKFEFSEDTKKLRELMLYVARKSEADPRFGAIKLNKILFYSDFLAYLRLGRPITGADYQKLELGPAPRRLLPLQKEMESKDSVLVERVFCGRKQKRLMAIREPDLSAFSGDEIALVDEILEICKGANATDLSEATHGLTAWKAFQLGESIPYTTVFIDDRPLTQAEREYASELEPTAA
jgi:hypothetical protein